MSRSAEYWFKLINDYMRKTKKFERNIKNMNPISLSKGNYKAEFLVTEDDLNKEGHFHEGLTATLVDVSSSHALLSEGNGFAGVSTNIHIAHFQPAFAGDVLSIYAKVCRIQNPLAFVEVELSRKNGEELIARGQHTLFLRPLVEFKS